MAAKLLAARVGASALRGHREELAIQLPALSLLDRGALARRLAGVAGVRVTRPALRLPLKEDDEWRANLLELLQLLAEDEGYARARARLKEQRPRPAGALTRQ